MEGKQTTDEELSKSHGDNLVSSHVAEQRDMSSRIHEMESSPEECATSENGLQRRARNRDNLVSTNVSDLRDMMSATEAMESRDLSKECWITIPQESPTLRVQETGFSGFVTEQRGILRRTQGMESRSLYFPQITGGLVRWLLLPHVVILTHIGDSARPDSDPGFRHSLPKFRRVMLSKECWMTIPTTSSVQENNFSGYVAEQGDTFSRIQGMESRSHYAPPILGELIRWLLLLNVVILTLDRGFSKNRS